MFWDFYHLCLAYIAALSAPQDQSRTCGVRDCLMLRGLDAVVLRRQYWCPSLRFPHQIAAKAYPSVTLRIDFVRCKQDDRNNIEQEIKNVKLKRCGLKESNHWPAILKTAKITKRPSTSNAALNIRMSCVLGSTNRHTKPQIAAISPIRKTRDKIFLSIQRL